MDSVPSLVTPHHAKAAHLRILTLLLEEPQARQP